MSPLFENATISETPPGSDPPWWYYQSPAQNTFKQRENKYHSDLASAKGWVLGEEVKEEGEGHDTEQEGFGSERQIGRRQRWVLALVEGSGFGNFCTGLILVNTVLMGVQVEYMALTRATVVPPSITAIQETLSIAFFLELVIRMYAFRLNFFSSPDRMWNLFDFLVVSVSMLELLVKVLGPGSDGTSSFSVFRMLRVLRIVRAFRVIRVMRFFRDLRIMVCAIYNSAMPMIWAVILILIIMFIFGVHLTQTVTEFRNESDEDSLGDVDLEYMLLYWGSLHMSMYTLFQVMSGGVSWGDVARPLVQLHWSYAIIMSGFVAFMVFAVLNIITGLFVDTAMQGGDDDANAVIEAELSSEGSNIGAITDVMRAADADHSGFIDVGEFDQIMQDDYARTCFQSLGLELNEIWGMFRLLDMADTGAVEIEEFSVSLLRLKSSASKVDLPTLLHENKRMIKQIATFMVSVDQQLRRLIGSINSSSSQVSSKHLDDQPQTSFVGI